jgi:hypothetical protein
MQLLLVVSCVSMTIMLLLQFRSYGYTPHALRANTTLKEKWATLQTLFATETPQ